MSNGGKSSKRPRVFFAIVYFVIALFLFYFFKEKIFYLDLESSSYHFYRFIWCVGASFIGFSVLLFKIIDSKSSVFPSYITYYPVMLCAQAALGACRLNKQPNSAQSRLKFKTAACYDC